MKGKENNRLLSHLNREIISKKFLNNRTEEESSQGPEAKAKIDIEKENQILYQKIGKILLIIDKQNTFIRGK